MFNINEIEAICKAFSIPCHQIGDVIDTSKGEDDKRYNYNMDNKYFLKINSSKVITENFLQEILRLTLKYRAIGVYCPTLIKNNKGNLAYYYEKEGIQFTCYVEECAPYRVYPSQEDRVDYAFKKTVVGHLGVLAQKFSNKDLCATRSMWSLIELGPFDTDRDEKQENLDTLIHTLKEHQYDELAERLIGANQYGREKIENYLQQLPRCVYQGDLNESNLLIDEQGAFKGIIDFNMFGTEVNINCFLNETMYYIEKLDFEILTAVEIFDKMNKVQEIMVSAILESYKLNSLEVEVWDYYKKIIYMSFYPNVMLWNALITKGQYVDKVIELIDIILEM